MPPKTGHVWDASTERDLILACWSSSSPNGDFKTDWTKAHQLMSDWGYSYSKDAIR